MPELREQQSIVVGVDGSPSSDSAVRWAAREAAMRNVPLGIFHLIETPPWGLVSPSDGSLPPVVGDNEWQKAEGAEIISAAVKIAQESTDDATRLRVHAEIYFAATMPTLVGLSKYAQMMVVGRRGRGQVRSLLLGSVGSGLVHHAHCPVALIHTDSSVAALDLSQRPVVVGIDGSPTSELATALAFDEASRRQVRLVALHSWCHGDAERVPSLEWSAQEEIAREALAERLAGWRERYPDVAVDRKIAYNSPASHLLKEAESAQLVVVGSRGRGGFSGMLLGSVSNSVVQAAKVPVIVARRQC
jgi:nucleotide-binding universal stress UspA family protein